MEKISEKLERIIRSIVVGLLLVLLIVLIFVVAVQGKHIDKQAIQIDSMIDAAKVIDERLDAHEEMTDFMNEGKRFTYDDGRVLFLMCNGFEASDRVKGRARGIYSEHGSTDFNVWLKNSGYLE